MKLILHIGVPKTGTSAIQLFLWENRNLLLKKHAILYPESGSFNVYIYPYKAHYKIAYSFPTIVSIQASFKKEEIFSSLSEEIRLSKPKAVILSCETFSLLKKTEDLYNSLKGLDFEDIYVVVYLRRQDLWFESSYKQVIKTGEYSGPFNKIPNATHMEVIDYNRLLAKWTTFVPPKNIYIKIYDRRILYKNNVIDDFCLVLSDILKDKVDLKTENYKTANPSFSHLSALVKLRVCQNYVITSAREHVEISNYLLTLDKEEGSGPLKTFFTLEERIEFLERFRESNERLFREWFNSENKFVLTPEEIEFYKEQDKIPKDEIERLVEERYQKVVENVIKKFEAKPKVYIPVELSKLVKEGEVVEKVVIDQLYLDLLKGSKLVVG